MNFALRCLLTGAFIQTFAVSLAMGQQPEYLMTGGGDGIAVFRVNTSSGALNEVPGSPFPGLGGYGNIASDPKGRFVYAIHNADSVSGFSVNASTGALTPVPGLPIPAGSLANQIRVDPLGKFVYVSNENSLDVSGYKIDQVTGALSSLAGSPYRTGLSGFDLAVAPTDDYVFVASNGGGIAVLSMNQNTGVLVAVPGSPFPLAANATSIVVHPNGRFIYVANFAGGNSGNIFGFAFDHTSAQLTPLPGSPYNGVESPHYVVTDPAGKYLYAANTHGGSTSGYAIDQTTGTLTLMPGSPFPAGQGPQSVSTDPTGQFAYELNIVSLDVWSYTINQQNGSLSATGSPVPVVGANVIVVQPTGGVAPVIIPNHGGNAGSVTIQVIASGIQGAATISLTGIGPDIPGQNVSVTSTALVATFDLTEAVPGLRTVVVKNPDSTSLVLPDQFTIDQGGSARLTVSIIGRGQVRIGTPQTYYIAAHNPGLINSRPASIFITVPQGMTVNSLAPLITAPGVPTDQNLTQWIDTGREVVLGVMVPGIAAQATVYLPVQIIYPVNYGTEISSNEAIGPPSARRNGLNPQFANQCLSSRNTRVLSSSPDSIGSSPVAASSPFIRARVWINDNICGGPGPCWTSIVGVVPYASCVMNSVCLFTSAAAGDWVNFWWYTAWASISCTPQGATATAIGNLLSILVNCPGGDDDTELPLAPVSSLDPNDKLGERGVGPARYVMGSSNLGYAISFQNEPSATAPAQTVVVTDQLSTTADDLRTFSLGPIAFQGQFLNPPHDSTAYTATIDLRPETNLLVGVKATVDVNTGIASWTFSSIDPLTGQPTSDPTVGVLPPGGTGSVFFEVRPIDTLPTDTQIKNQATVVFDANPAIATPVWTNTLDNTSPVSLISPLASVQQMSCFHPYWTGSDVGSGLAGFTIFVSDNGGPYNPWLTNTKLSSGLFTGRAGHSYTFYSQATDFVGNVEPTKTNPDTATTIAAGSSCNGRPTLAAAVISKSLNASMESISLQFTNSGLGNAPNATLNRIAFRTLSGSGVVTLANPAVPIQLGSLAAGESMTITLTLNLPFTVKEFSMTETGSLQDLTGNTYAFSIGQAVFP